VTLKIECDIDILKLCLTLKIKLLAQGIQKLKLKNSEFAAIILTCTHDLETERDLDIPKMCLQTENEVARSNHSKYIARIEKSIKIS